MNAKNSAPKRFGVKGMVILSLTVVAMASLFFIVYESMKKKSLSWPMKKSFIRTQWLKQLRTY